jgi:hypothetical protein
LSTPTNSIEKHLIVTWELRGAVTLCEKGKPLFPKVGKVPGLYRLLMNDGSCYVGQTEDLDRRLSEYRHPTQGVEIEYLIHHALIDAGGAALEIFTHDDLSLKTERCKLEQEEIRTAKDRFRLVRNGPTTDLGTIGAKIKFHENEVARLNKALTRSSQ